MNQRYIAENGIDDASGGLDRVFTVEKRSVPADRVARQPLVGRHLIARLLVRDELDFLADHRLAGHFDARSNRDDEIGTETKTAVIGVAGNGFAKNRMWGCFSLTTTSVPVTGRTYPSRRRANTPKAFQKM